MEVIGVSWLNSRGQTPQKVLNGLFFVVLFSILVQNPGMFWKRHGKYHALLGLFYLMWLTIGFLQVANDYISYTMYDVILGLSGTLLALTAAAEFQHKNIENSGSGTLDEHATVTYNEMIEHAFYQGLNLAQVLFLHIISRKYGLGMRIVFVAIASSPWLIRHLFPVNKFSDNYVKIDQNSSNLIRLLYRIKKYQYVFYKHFLLHGLLISVALHNDNKLVENSNFRMYWMLLNTSYVMEFFLQTLVKKRYMSQSIMLGLQHVLMLSATISALFVLGFVRVDISLASLIGNFINRKNDFWNTLFIMIASAAVVHSDEFNSLFVFN